VSRKIRVPLLESHVLLDVSKVISSQDHCTSHLGRLDDSTENTTTNRDSSGERTLPVNVCAIDGFLRSLEAKTDFLVESSSLRACLTQTLGLDTGLESKDMGLLLERLLVLQT